MSCHYAELKAFLLFNKLVPEIYIYIYKVY